MKCYVYIIFRPNGVPCYVGKGSGARWKRNDKRKRANNHLAAIMAQTTKPLPVVIIKEGLTDAEAHALEITMIAAIGREIHGGPLVNNTDGGEGTTGWVRTEEWCRIRALRAREVWMRPEYRALQTAERKTRRHSEATKQKYRESFKDPEIRARKLSGLEKSRGRKHTEESRAKLKARVFSDEAKANMRAAAAKRWANPEYREKHKNACANRGPVSPETKAKISAAGKGREKSAETREKLSKALKGKVRKPRQTP